MRGRSSGKTGPPVPGLTQKKTCVARGGPTRQTRSTRRRSILPSTRRLVESSQWLARRETSALMSLNDTTCQELARAHHNNKN
jgi:hypothetical protein